MQQEERKPNLEDPSWDESQPIQSYLAKKEQLRAYYETKEKEDMQRKRVFRRRSVSESKKGRLNARKCYSLN